ncbi:MAG: DUF1080 domain-containing protein, partial [Verrucomicrobiota bacterium]
FLPLFALVALATNSFAQETEWKSLFDGKSLKGWDGDPKFWSIKDGAITGTTTEENPTRGNTFIIFTGENADNEPAEFSDFELKLKFRIEGHNSGIQYRAFKADGPDRWRVGGYQSDFDAKNGFTGANYGERFRGMLAHRGQKSVITGTKQVKHPNQDRMMTVVVNETEQIGDSTELAKGIKTYPEWNEMHIIAKGNTLTQKVNGVTMSIVVDNDKENARDKGLIAVQLHGGPPMVAQVKDVMIKE